MNLQYHPIRTAILRTARSGALTLVCVAALNIPLSAAESGADVPRSFASYDDLDLSRPAGVAALHKRVHAAAEEVCSDYGFALHEPGRVRKWNNCVAEAKERAATQVAAAIERALAQRSIAGRACPEVASATPLRAGE